MLELIQLKQKDIKKLKQELHEAHNGVCPLLGIEVPLDAMTLDHKHKRIVDPAGPNGNGLIRGAIEFRANAMEGKITNNWKRYFGANESTHPILLPDFLRNLADYLEDPPCEQIYIHPSEKPKSKILKKSCYNKLVKQVNGKQMVPVYHKKQKLTKGLEKLFTKYKVGVEYYKN
jgi:hypothetical protein